MKHYLVGAAQGAAVMAAIAAAFLAGAEAVAAQGAGVAYAKAIVASRPAQYSAQESPRVSYEGQHVTVEAVLSSIGKQSGLALAVNRSAIALSQSLAQRISVAFDNVSLTVALRDIARQSGLSLRVAPDGQTIMVSASNDTQRQVETGVVAGRVVHSKTKQPIAGATIAVNGISQTATTGNDGTFRLPVPAGTHIATVKAIGFVRYSQRVAVIANQTIAIEVVLEPSASVLDEVVVTGTIVATERKAISTPITVITAKDIEQRGVTTVAQLLRGEVPGMLALESGSQSYRDYIGSNVTTWIYSRGATSLTGASNPPKIYIDGVEMLDPNMIGTIDVQSIDRMEIITGPQAATVYGSGAMGGVMQIFTKRGLANTAPEFTLSLKYGMLENSFSNGLTPSHTHALNMTGSAGPQFSYAGSATYNYTGQWQPALFAQSYGTSLGMTYSQGPIILDGSVSLRNGSNGTMGGNVSYCGFNQVNTGCVTSPYLQKFINDGDYRLGNGYTQASTFSQRISTSATQTLALNLDYRVTSIWQHHLTLGRTQTESRLIPERPKFVSPFDTMFSTTRSIGTRYTNSYNTTFSPVMGSVRMTMTFGINQAWRDGSTLSGCIAKRSATEIIGCSSWDNVRASQPSDDHNGGGFGSWQFAFFDQFFVNAAVRGEQSRAYGDNHGIDWTPTLGMSYTMDLDVLTLKLLGSYGRATRPPQPEWREGVKRYRTPQPSDPDGITEYWSLVPNADLAPEYSVGPQGGFEAYFGNHGSLTINYYSQNISNLIQQVIVDTVCFSRIDDGRCGSYSFSQKYVNVANIRQKGVEGTGSITLGPFGLKGTYSWIDSRVRTVSALPSYFNFQAGSVFSYVPSHTGNLTATFARGGTSVLLGMNWVGASIQSGGTSEFMLMRLANSRHSMYTPNTKAFPSMVEAQGSAVANLSASHRITGSVAATLNVSNLGNNHRSEMGALYPTLGRTTTFGLTFRYR